MADSVEQMIEIEPPLGASEEFIKEHAEACYRVLLSGQSIHVDAWAGLDLDYKNLFKQNYWIEQNNNRLWLGKEKTEQEIAEIKRLWKSSLEFSLPKIAQKQGWVKKL